MSKVKGTVLLLFGISLIMTFLFSMLYLVFKDGVCYSLAVTSGTILYHFAMRLSVGKLVGNNFNYKSSWFKQKYFEKNLYKLLAVKKWKGKMPSYNPKSYITKAASLNETVNTMCRNEVIHEINALLSFVPILFSLFAGKILVFIITSVIGCIIDLIFVIMQRYNRPRAVKIMERNKSRLN